MRNYLLLLLICLLASVTGYAQTPPKKANTIIIQVPDSSEVAWKRVAAALLAAGYSIKSSEKDFLTVSTELRPENKTSVETALTATVAGRDVTLTGVMVLRALSGTPSRIDYRGMNGSPALIAWEAMERIARQLGGTVRYETR